MRPIQLGGHSRPITSVKINRDGDLLFTTSKDQSIMVWYMSNGERLGTYDGHTGAIFDWDVDFDSKYGLSAGADMFMGLWRVETGKNLRLIMPHEPYRVTAVSWNCGCKQFAVAVLGRNKVKDKQEAPIYIYNFDEKFWANPDIESSHEQLQPVLRLPTLEEEENCPPHSDKITKMLWGPTNKYIYTASDDGTIRKFGTKKHNDNMLIHFSGDAKDKTRITDLKFSRDKTLLISAGKDHTARLYEANSLTQLKLFRSNKPLNCCCLHPLLNVVMVGGGQEAMDVTTTSASKGKFQIEFFHTVFEEKIGEIRTGHFSPLNAIQCSQDGTYFVTGSEEGNCRIFKFDSDFENKFLSLEKSFTETTI